MSENLAKILSFDDLNEIKKDFDIDIGGSSKKGQEIEIDLRLIIKFFKKGEKEFYFYDSNRLFEAIESQLIAYSSKKRVNLIDSLGLIEIKKEMESKNYKF